VQGEIIGFGGRVLDDSKPKYMNSPETTVFSKGRELYGLFEARQALRDKGYALVVEGYMDVVALAQLGFPNAVATLGTACTAEHVQKLFRFTDSVVFSFDGDAAGRRAARKALDAALPYATDVRTIKFLFLPTEHDPDSFIRAYGRDAFADYVAQATPLSRFLMESAREGCDLDTAEGRAHMASNAKPLWGLLPEGALKLQLLGELAVQVQLPSQDLGALWAAANAPTHAKTPAAKRQRSDWQPDDHDEHSPSATTWGHPLDGEGATNSWKGKGKWEGKGKGKWEGRGKWDNKRPVRPPLRGPLANRADHATRVLLGHCGLWETLSSEDHALLCELPAPHGPLLAWLEAQLHEHGPLAWGALREELVGHESESLALRLMADPALVPSSTADAAREMGSELRDLLNRMLVERIKEQETLAIDAANTDPAALIRYRELHHRRLQLEQAIRPPG